MRCSRPGGGDRLRDTDGVPGLTVIARVADFARFSVEAAERRDASWSRPVPWWAPDDGVPLAV